MRWYFYSASYPESKCHPERSDCFATRSSRAVEGPLSASQTEVPGISSHDARLPTL